MNYVRLYSQEHSYRHLFYNLSLQLLLRVVRDRHAFPMRSVLASSSCLTRLCQIMKLRVEPDSEHHVMYGIINSHLLR